MNNQREFTEPTPHKSGNKTPSTPGKPRFPVQWNRRFLLWLALLWFVFVVFLNPGRQEVGLTLPYSAFKQQVAQGQVELGTIQGDRIHGQFSKPMPAPGEPEGKTYHYFRTVMPSFDDPKLVSLLEANQVTIQAQEERTS